MMWFRRTVAIILAIVFVLLFIPLLVIFRVNSTAANPNFYVGQLRQNDVYNFAYDEVLPAAVDEAFKDADTQEELLSLIKPRVVPFVEEALPRAWVQEQVEQGLRQGLPYILGDSKSFTIEASLRERVIALSGAVTGLLDDEEFFSELYDRGIDYLLDENEDKLRDTPFTSEQLKSVARKALPPEWISAQLTGAIDEVTPYFIGDMDSFAVNIQITDRYDDIESAVIELLSSQDVYDYVSDELLVPTVKQYAASITDLPVEVIISVDEIVDVSRAAFTPEWYHQEVTTIVGQVISYLKGNTQNLDLSLELADRKQIIISELDRLVTQKLGRDVSDLVLPVIIEHVNDWIPDRWSLNEVIEQVSDNFDIEKEIEEARDNINKGISYTDTDLRSDLKDNYQTFDDIREKVSLGYVFTDQDFNDQLSARELEDIDTARSINGKIRHWMWVVWIIPVLMLVGIGVLGDRKWTNMLIWGASVLGAASFIVIILTGPVYSALAKPEINRALTDAVDQTSGLEKLVVDKAISISQNTINSFVSGLLIQGIILLIVSLAVIAFAIFWNYYKSGTGPSEPPSVVVTSEDISSPDASGDNSRS